MRKQCLFAPTTITILYTYINTIPRLYRLVVTVYHAVLMSVQKKFGNENNLKPTNYYQYIFFPINFSFRSEIKTAHNYNMCAQAAAVCLYQQFHNSRQPGELNSVFSANDCENFHMCILKCLHGHVFNANFILLSQTIFCNSVAQWQWLYIICYITLVPHRCNIIL